MSIAIPAQPGSGSAVKHKCRQLMVKSLVSAAIALGAGVAGAAAASADDTPNVTDPAFGALSCDCETAAPPDSPVRRRAVHRGMQEGLSNSLAGQPKPAGPGQAQS